VLWKGKTMEKVIHVGDKAWNRTLGCEVTILSPVRGDGTVHIETPYGNVYCYPRDLWGVIKDKEGECT
jgi:hypothetical protein